MMVRHLRSLASILLVLALAGRPGRCRAEEPPPAESFPRGPAEAPSSAWFAGVEVGLFHPLLSAGTFATQGNVKLDWTAAPRVELGYRLDAGGAPRVAFRNISTSGHENVTPPGFDGGRQDNHLRLEVNWLDLDYVSGRDPAKNGGGASWEFGLRLASKFVDSGAADSFTSRSSRNLFLGLGPHFGVSRTLPLGQSGFGLYGRADVALLFGAERQSFETRYGPAFNPFGPSDPGTSSTVSTRRWDSRVLGDAGFQLGVSWDRTFGERCAVRGVVGAQAEFVGFGSGQFVNYGKKDAHLLDGLGSVGPFLRFEIAY